jgi:hypothetical protein
MPDTFRVHREHDPERAAAIRLLDDIFRPADEGVPETVLQADPQAVEAAVVVLERSVNAIAFPQAGEIFDAQPAGNRPFSSFTCSDGFPGGSRMNETEPSSP